MLKYGAYLKSDDLIAHHLDLLYDKMLEANLLKIIHPYRYIVKYYLCKTLCNCSFYLSSSVEISHVAKLINLPEAQVVHKLSQMVLDKKFFGILDQGRGHLIIYESADEDVNFTKGVEVIANMENVVEALFGRSKALVKTNA